MKKIIALSLILTLLLSMSGVFSAGAAEPPCLQWGDYQYTLLEDGNAEITGYMGNSSEVIIPSEIEGTKVTSVGSVAFLRNKTIKSVTVPDGVTNVGHSAFYGCINLETLSLPDSIESMTASAVENTALYYNRTEWKDGALYIGNHLVKADGKRGWGVYKVKEGTVSICGSAFQDNLKIREIILPDSMRSIGNSAFSYCPQLEKINFPEGLVYIGDSCFSDCRKLSEVKLPSSVTSLSNWAFNNCGIKELTIPGTLEYIGHSAFMNCEKLETVTISEGVTFLGDGVFLGCEKLKDISLPQSLEYIGGYAFNGTAYAQAPENLDSGVLYFGDYLLQADSELAGKIYVKEGTKKIATSAFSECDSLTAVYLPSSVEYIGDRCFSQCGELEVVSLSPNIKEIPENAFHGCSEIDFINIPQGIQKIGAYAFLDCFNLTLINVPASVSSIDEYAIGYVTQWDQQGCIVYESGVNPTEVTISGCKNSAAEKYAEENGLIFKDAEAPEEYKYKDKVLELLNISEVDDGSGKPILHYYSEGYEYFSSPDESTPDYVLITAYENVSADCEITERYGNYVVHSTDLKYPGEELGHHIYLPETNEIYSLSDAYNMKLEGIYNVFTHGGVGKLIGDVNYDSSLNIRDVTLLQKYLTGLENLNKYAIDESYTIPVADFNGDSNLNIRDATAIQKHLAGLDGKVIERKVLGIIYPSNADVEVFAIAQNLEELKTITQNLNSVKDFINLNDIFTEEYFNTKSVIVISDVIGGSCCSQKINNICTSGIDLTVSRTIRSAINPVCDLNPQCVLIEVNKEDIKDIFNVFVYSNTEYYEP